MLLRVKVRDARSRVDTSSIERKRDEQCMRASLWGSFGFFSELCRFLKGHVPDLARAASWVSLSTTAGDQICHHITNLVRLSVNMFVSL